MAGGAKGEPPKHVELYPCAAICGLTQSSPGEIDERCRLRCALPGFSEANWGPADSAPREYMGKLPVVGNDEIAACVERDENPDAPPDTHEDGCPGAWYRCGFVRSLIKYERLLGDSVFSSNVLLDRCTDRLVIEATQYIEFQRMRKRERDTEQQRNG